MPGIGVRTAARILLEIGDASAFKSSGPGPPMPASLRSPVPPDPQINAALICLTRRRCDVLFAMLRNKTYYRHADPIPAPTAA